MPITHDQIISRFSELATEADQIKSQGRADNLVADPKDFYAWVSAALNVIQGVFGKESPHYERLNAEVSHINNNYIDLNHLNACRGIFLGAKSDVDHGFIFNLEAAIAGEVFGDFVSAAKSALSEGHHLVAAVLACAALEDALKRYAILNKLSVDGKTMDEIVNALKSSGLVGGAQKSLLSTMPKIRNYTMHANWDKLTPQDVGSVLGFVEQFLLEHF